MKAAAAAMDHRCEREYTVTLETDTSFNLLMSSGGAGVV